MRFRHVKLLVFFFIFLFVNTFNVNAETKEVTVGFYENYPYYYLDSKGNPQGYYHDVMKIIAKELNINFRYETLTFDNYLNKLKNEEVDLILGIKKTKETNELFEYSEHIVNNKSYYVFTNKNIEFGDIDKLEGLTFGYIPTIYGYKYFDDLLLSNGIHCQKKVAKSIEELKEWMQSGEIDFTISNGYDNFYNEYNELYMYSLGAGFIASPNHNKSLINKIDNALDYMCSKNDSELYKIYNHYFNNSLRHAQYIIFFLVSGIMIVILIFLFNMIQKRLNKKKFLNKYLNNDKFKLFYQPIINLKNNNIIGFESLLRLEDNGKILTPYYFLSKIEKLDIMYDITLWTIEKSLQNYHKLKFKINSNSKFYVSINISYKDLLHPNFINDVQAILNKYEKMEYYLCFEITERDSSNDFDKINKRIASLKSMGIIFAMDDFGIKYSNFDTLQKIDYDIVKLDKIFIDGCENSIKNQQILKAILDILHISEKKIVIEGAETLDQIKLIKLLGRDKVCVQGYYYSRPLPIDELD